MKNIDETNQKQTDVTLSDIIPGGVAGIRLSDGKLLFVGDGLYALTGYTEDDLQLDLSYVDLIYPEDREMVLRTSSQQLEVTGRVELSYRILKKDGTPLWIKCYSAMGTNAEYGAYSLSLFVDYSEEKRIFAEKEQMRLELDSLIKAIPGGVVKLRINEDYDVTLASDGYYELMGYTSEEFHAPPLEGRARLVVVEEDIPYIMTVIRELLETGRPAQAVYRIRKKDGSIAWNTFYFSGYEKQGGDCIVQGVVIDNTKVKNMENQLLNLTNSIPGGIIHVSISENGRSVIHYASDGFYRMSGFSKNEYEAIGHRIDLSPSIHPDDLQMVLDAIQNYMTAGEPYETSLDYRILCKNGMIRWTRAKGTRSIHGQQNSMEFLCVLTDITEIKETEQKVHLGEERYRIICEQTEDIVFDWNLKTGSIYYSPAFERKFGYLPPLEDTLHYVLSTGVIHPEDVSCVTNLADRLKAGQIYEEAEFRFRSIDGVYTWCRLRVTALFDGQGQTARAVGTISDISTDKLQKDILKERAQKDLLTGVYNKMTAQEQIETALGQLIPGWRHALFIIDIDNFKDVNDTFGHAMGDALLSEISQQLQQHFREEDIIGRIGGDEFVVFLRNVKSQTDIRQRAEEIIELFHQCLNEVGTFQVSSSIGVAICPTDGGSFEELYKKADVALYHSKFSGKNRYTFYSEEIFSGEQTVFRERGIIESDASEDHDFFRSIFESLYSAVNIKGGIQIALELIARYLHMERAYIYEADDEWLVKTVEFSSEKGRMAATAPMYSKKLISRFMGQCDNDSVFFCPNTKSLPYWMREDFEKAQISSVLQVALWDGDDLCGIVGFVGDEMGTRFTKKIREECVLHGKILGSFLMKQRYKSKIQQLESKRKGGSAE